MIRPIITLKRRRIIIDVDTQKDFLLADGKKPVRNHRRVMTNIRRTMAWARFKNIRMISTCQIYDPQDSRHDYCKAGTVGQEKISYTIRSKHTSFAADGCTDLPRDILLKNEQVILDKRSSNPFEEPRAERMLSELRADEFIVFGAVTEDAVKKTVLGLLARRKHVTLLTDAVGSHNKEAAEVAMRQMEAKGAKLVESKNLFGGTSLKLVGACSCDRCQGRMQKPLAKTGS